MSRPRVPRQRRSRAKYDAILRAAIQILSEQGYSQASTVKIAGAAGVSVGTVYAYFPDKDAIFSAYVNERVGEIFAAISQSLVDMRASTLEETVRGVVTASVVFSMNNRKSLNAMVGKIPGVYDGSMLQDVMQQLYIMAAAYYDHIGLTDDRREADTMTYTLTNAITGYFVRMVTDEDVPVDKQEMIEELVILIMGYFNERTRRR